MLITGRERDTKYGVRVGDYGPCAAIDDASGDGNPIIGYLEPAGGGNWILWFTANGDAVIYTNRYDDGGVIGEPIRLKGH